jgi:hypothetical protein
MSYTFAADGLLGESAAGLCLAGKNQYHSSSACVAI